ncbi:MAG TPA: hypothetical protein VK325_08290 [Pseudoxanthomonas sp.]|nr:hypothetical protein [Pseudoxanthomonas sp.]
MTTANGALWQAAGWVFRNILDRTAEVLCEQGCESLAHLIGNDESVVRLLEVLQPEELSKEDRPGFFDALRLCYRRYESEGAKNRQDPEFFLGL